LAVAEAVRQSRNGVGSGQAFTYVNEVVRRAADGCKPTVTDETRRYWMNGSSKQFDVSRNDQNRNGERVLLKFLPGLCSECRRAGCEKSRERGENYQQLLRMLGSDPCNENQARAERSNDRAHGVRAIHATDKARRI